MNLSLSMIVRKTERKHRMSKHNIGKMIYFGKTTLTLARRLFGQRWHIVHKSWDVYKHVMGVHFRGTDKKGRKFVYCPVSLLVSWHPGDYDHEWCHACQLFFSAKVEALLTPEERERMAAK